MGEIIPFRSRDEWEEEKKERIRSEWESYLAWEEEHLRKVREERSQED
ncbi:hypothetical protein [Pseudobacillus badius]|nr:hypothetical protein [Bacillus badius]KIL74631.1 hypothetical protein SD78_1700 [Bacillus badius]GLY10876.1 hypothetical protein Bbad01_20920 [Bacillus badius]